MKHSEFHEIFLFWDEDSNVNKSRITFSNKEFDYYVPSNVIVLNRLNSTQKIFEMQSCCADTTNRRLVYAIDTKSTDKDATVQGEIYMVNNLLTKL